MKYVEICLCTCECGNVFVDKSGNSKKYSLELVIKFNVEHVADTSTDERCPVCNSEDSIHENLHPEYGGMARKIYHHIVNSAMQATKVRIKKSLYRRQELGLFSGSIATLHISAFDAPLFSLTETLLNVRDRLNDAYTSGDGISEERLVELIESLEKYL